MWCMSWIGLRSEGGGVWLGLVKGNLCLDY